MLNNQFGNKDGDLSVWMISLDAKNMVDKWH